MSELRQGRDETTRTGWTGWTLDGGLDPRWWAGDSRWETWNLERLVAKSSGVGSSVGWVRPRCGRCLRYVRSLVVDPVCADLAVLCSCVCVFALEN